MHTPCRTHIFLTHVPCVAYRPRVHAWLKVFAVRTASRPPFPTLTSAPSLPNCSRSASAGQAHFRTSGGKFGHLTDATHSTGYEPKEFDKITSADGDTTRINDSNYDNISGFSKITRENTGLFGVSTMLEASVSHVSPGESKNSTHREK